MIICAAGVKICKDYHRGQCRRLTPCSYKAERKQVKKTRQAKPVNPGQRLETMVDQHMRTCPECGLLYSDKLEKCPNCQPSETRE